jgi:ABC-type lipoprotein export system ATPase subunit
MGGIFIPKIKEKGQVLYDDKNILKMDDETLSEFRLENIGFVFQFLS